MRLISAVVFATLAIVGSANASSIVVLGDSATSPSSVISGTPGQNTASVIEIGTPAIDNGKVAAVDKAPGPGTRVMRGGDLGGASAQPVVTAEPAEPTSQATQGTSK